jgi:hypothetical protein
MIAQSFCMECDRLLAELCLELQVDTILIYLIEPESGHPFFFAGNGFEPDPAADSGLQSWKGLTWRVIHKHDIVSIHDIWSDQAALVRKEFFIKEGFISYQGIPLTLDGRLLGVLETFDRVKRTRESYWFFQFRKCAKTLSKVIFPQS